MATNASRSEKVAFAVERRPQGELLRAELEARGLELQGCTRAEQIQGVMELLDDIHCGGEVEPTYDEIEFSRSPEGKKRAKSERRNWQRITGSFLTSLCYSWTSYRLPKSVLKTAFTRWARKNPGPSALTGEYGPWHGNWSHYIPKPDFLEAA